MKTKRVDYDNLNPYQKEVIDKLNEIIKKLEEKRDEKPK